MPVIPDVPVLLEDIPDALVFVDDIPDIVVAPDIVLVELVVPTPPAPIVPVAGVRIVVYVYLPVG